MASSTSNPSACERHASERRGLRRALSTLGVLASLAARPVAAQEPGPGDEVCMAAYTDNQRLRKKGDLLAARDALRTCADPSCPDLVVKDCTTWLEQLEAGLPSLVLAVKDAQGDDVVDARVMLDGEELPTAFDGKPIEINPGTHELVVSRGVQQASKSVVVRSGEKGRAVTIQLGPERTPPPPPEVVPIEVDEGPPALLITGGVLAGLGAVGLGVFAGLGSVGAAEAGDLEDRCGRDASNTCTRDEVDAARMKLIAADVSLAIGATMAALGLTLIVVDLAGDDEPGVVSASDSAGLDSGQLTLGAGPLAGGAYGQLQLRY